MLGAVERPRQYDWCASAWIEPPREPLPFPELPDDFFEDDHCEHADQIPEPWQDTYAREVCISRYGAL